MLKLRRVQILGFKSFCDRTEVPLAGHGIAAIVGPNGCGKSNISDSITWVLGEQSAKSLRGTKMDDVIFAGTRDRKPTGMAEVSLTLVDPDVYDPADGGEAVSIASADRRAAELQDWDEAAERTERAEETAEATALAQPGPWQAEDDGEPTSADEAVKDDLPPSSEGPVVLKVRRRIFNRAPVRAGEVTVTRRLFRSGDSEYLLNGKLCRLRDIQDIFFGTGLTGENYAIIGQERIGQLLSSKPLDRRAIIEEAAGVTRFKTKKRLAELRLEASRQNLARIDDIFDEVSKQVGSLKRQVAKAERYGQLRDELQSKLRIVLRSRLLQKMQEHRSAEAESHKLGVLIDAQAVTLATLDAEHSTTVARGYALEEELRNTQAGANDVRVEMERVGVRIASNTDRIADFRARSAAVHNEVAQLTQQVAALAAERQALVQDSVTALGAAEQARVTTRARQEEASAAQAKLNAADREASEGRQQSLQLTHRISQIHREEGQFSEALANLRREAERLTAESEQARQEIEELGRQRGQVSLSFESTTERLSRLTAEIACSRIDLETGRKEEQELRRSGDGLRGQLATLKGKKQSLDAQLRDHSYSTETVRKLLRARTEGSTAPLGTLADFLEVDDDHGAIIDEFLREELNTIDVRDWESARAGMDLLGTAVEGRATFLIQNDQSVDADGACENGQTLQIPGATALGMHVRAYPRLGRVPPKLQHKLQSTYLVTNAAAAHSLAISHPDLYVLTETGEVFHDVTVTGGKARSGGPLAVKGEARATDLKLDEVQAQLSACDIALATIGRRLSELQHAMDAQRESRVKAEREAADSGAALRQMELEGTRIERRLSDWSLQSERNRDAIAAKLIAVEQKQADTTRLAAEQEAVELRVQDASQAIVKIRGQREAAQVAAAVATAALAGLEERNKNATANLSRNEHLHGAAEQRLKTLEAHLVAGTGECARREEENASFAAQAEELSARHQQLSGESAARSAEMVTLRDDAERQNARLRAVRAEHDISRERRGTLQTAAARLSAEIEHLEAQSLQDLNTPAAELQADTTIGLVDPSELNAADTDTRSLRSKMEAMGPVNMMAVEEFQEASQRHSFLQDQRTDLLESITNTQGAIREIDDVTKHKFNEAFTIINRNFSETFTKLFGGGQALMRLTDDADLMDSGIDLIASPPGKKLQNVLLLSGGEKALTALSLLVGIFQHQPSPFCILDEVDAPLDETNVGRLATLIQEMSRDTQFLVITHHKRTISQDDLIYGVTMQEPGVSKIVSVNLTRSDRRAVA